MTVPVVTAGRYRTHRGGSNFEIAAALRSADRHVFYPEAHFPIVMRCARTP